MINRRKGPGVKWVNITKTGTGEREVTGFTVDNLNTKSFEQAINNYERVFIKIREVLEDHAALCMDVEKERLDVCQAISDVLSCSGLMSKGND